jgi:hypothetical protein
VAEFVTGHDVWFTRAEIANGPWTAWTGRGAGDVTTNPLFVNMFGGDFHLQASSPAIDAGTPTGAPGNDVENRARTPPPDIGAYERVTSSTWWLCLPLVCK